MSIRNPNNNQEPTPDSGRTDNASNVSPKPTGPRNFVNLEPNDDLRPERIERLGQYLSDSTMGNVTNDVRSPGKNFFPISAEPVEATTTVTNQKRAGQDRYTDFIQVAKDEFDKLSQSSAFSAETFDPSMEDRVKGHYILEGGPAQSVSGDTGKAKHKSGSVYVNREIENAIGNGGRWGGVGQHRFAGGSPKSKPNEVDEHGESDQNPYFKVPPNGRGVELPPLEGSRVVDGSSVKMDAGGSNLNNGTQHSSYQTFSHRSTFPEESSRYAGDFWHKYFKRMSRVGAAITVKATGRDTATAGGKYDDFFTKNLERMKIMGNVIGAGNDPGSGNAMFLAGLHDEDVLGGIWGKKDVDDLYAGYAFLAGEDEFQDDHQMEERYGHPGHTHGGSRNARSWGSTYAYDDPFDNEGIPIVEGRQLSVVLELAQIYFSIALRAGLLGLFLEFSKYVDGAAASEAGLEADAPPAEGGQSGFWMNVFSPPQGTNPLHLEKGSGRYNQKLTNRMLHEFEHNSIHEFGPTAKKTPIERSLRNLVSGALFQGTAIIQDEFINFPRAILKEIGLYIPRHLLSLFDKDRSKVMGKNVGGQVATVYLQATASGLGHVGATILGGDFGMSIGFYRALFKELARSRAEFVSRSHMESIFKTMIDYLGKDDKNMGFMNYLARLGDLVAAQGIVGKLTFPYARVPIDQVGDHPSLRMARYRQKGTNRSTTSIKSMPSMYLLPRWITDPSATDQEGNPLPDERKEGGVGLTINEEMSLASGRSLDHTVGFELNRHDVNNLHNLIDEDEHALISKKYQSPEKGKNRFTPRQVNLMENQLEAEYMPFYIQDLRTNEIISFHAFITGLSDSFTGEWAGSKGFGRLEEVYTYGGASRSMSVDFTMVATSKEDFDELWWKANKLVTLVYPQFSRGTMMTDGTNKWVQPFSQVMTASPLCRLRLGDLFTSNYSKESIARLMGADDENFVWTDAETPSAAGGTSSTSNKIVDYITGETFLELYKTYHSTPHWNADDPDLQLDIELELARTPNKMYPVTISEPFGRYDDTVTVKQVIIEPPEVQTIVGADVVAMQGRNITVRKDMNWIQSNVIRRRELAANEGPVAGTFQSIFTNKNPIIKSFESTMGRGIACAIDAVNFEFKYGEFPWELEPGNRAPRWINVKLGFKPIHDITPGLDHNGFNRAPVYKVGKSTKSYSGDVWENPDDYKKVLRQATAGHEKALDGISTHVGGSDHTGEGGHQPVKEAEPHGRK